MALLSAQAVVPAGVQQTLSAVSSSDTFVPSSSKILVVVNGGGSPDTVAIASPQTTRGGLSIGDAGGSVTNGTTKVFGPFPADLFADPTTGLTTVTHSFTTSVTCALYDITQI